MVGIGIGTGLAVLSLALLALLFRRRRRRKRRDGGFEVDYVIAPQPAPVPSPRRDVYFEKVAGHSRGVSAATTRVSSGDGTPDWRGGPGLGGRGAGDGVEADGGERPVRRSVPHPSSSSVGRMARFAEREGPGPGGMG